jgi:hypothetical protein
VLSPRIHCPNCDKTARAGTVQSRDISWEKYEGWGELDLSYKELTEETGAAVWKSEPKIHGFRRIRRCPNCRELIWTVEVEYGLVHEVIRLRALVAKLKPEARRASAAARAIKRLIG